MGSKVIFSRAPRGDAVQAPPPVGSFSQLGTSDRAAREDHTHEGVHRIAVGDGLSLSPSSGLGDVTLAVRHWRPPVQQATELPTTGNTAGDARVVLAEASIYVWTGAEWQKVTSASSGGGGGGGPGFDAWGALNRLHLGLEQVKTTNRPALTAYSERYDALVDDSGIDWTRSANVELRDGRIVARPSQWVGFGDDWAKVPGTVRFEEQRVSVSLAPGAFEYGLTGVLGAWAVDGCIAGTVTPARRLTTLATETVPAVGVVADGSFEGGVSGVVAALPAAVQPASSRVVRRLIRYEEPARFVPLSPGGFDFGVQAVVDGWGRTGSFEPGVTGVVVHRREVVQFTTGPLAQVQAADGTFEAGVTGVIQRPIRRGGTPVVVSSRLELPGSPAWAYVLAEGFRFALAVSRDDGLTWTPVESGSVADVSTLPPGNRLRVRAELQDEVRSYVAAWAYGAAQ